MAANQLPIYSRLGDIQWHEAVITANATQDLTSGTIYSIFTADATNGGFLTKIRFRPKGTNVVTVARIWINNGGANTVAANNACWDEVTLPATTGSAVTELAVTERALGFALPPGYRIYVTLGTTVAAGFHCSVIGGKY